ncbi:hypothetical protein AcV7_007721 [Taiwanofungus camphoratus]|nr:hypothetical protein AcV7_007721 [Antrodia cinnamomea]
MSIVASTAGENPDLLSPQADTTRVVSEKPFIVLSDHRYEGAPCFLYLPEGRKDIVFTDYLANLRVIAKWPIWKQNPPMQCHPPSFRVQQVPEKGLGMVAVRAIPTGELIIAERPICVGRRIISCAADQTNANGVFRRAALRGLSSTSRAAILALANSYPSPEFDTIPGILNTNCLAVRVTAEPAAQAKQEVDGEESVTYVGCFPTLSRANHDCAPTANYVFAFATFTGEFRAIRDIAAGEEITITYTPLSAPRAERRAFLARTRFFACTCATCALPPAKARESDARRVRIRDLLRKIEGARFPPRVPLQELQEAVGWARVEGLRVEEAQLLLCGSQVLTVYDELGVAVAWAREARRLFALIEGERSENIRKLDDADRVHHLMTGAPRMLRI